MSAPARDLAVREAWDKQPGESAKAFQAFSIYRDLGPSRSLAKAARALGKSSRTLEEFSQKYGWVERADAYDFHLDRQRQAEREEEIRSAERQEIAAARLATGAALQRLAGREAGVAENGAIIDEIESLDPGELDAAGVARLMEVGFRHRRLLHGQPTDLSKALDQFSLREVSEIVSEVVEAALADLPEERHEGFIRRVREIGLRRAS